MLKFIKKNPSIILTFEWCDLVVSVWWNSEWECFTAKYSKHLEKPTQYNYKSTKHFKSDLKSYKESFEDSTPDSLRVIKFI